MSRKKMTEGELDNQQRRTLLQGAVCVGVASFAPAAFGNSSMNASESMLTGELICDVTNPIKTLVLHNQANHTVVIDSLTHGAFMFDGSIVDCNGACANKPITLSANEKIEIQFDKRNQALLTHMDDFNRIQSRVTRLNDGTRVIPFSAKLKYGVATLA